VTIDNSLVLNTNVQNWTKRGFWNTSPKILLITKINQVSFYKKRIRKFEARTKPQTTEEKIKEFVLRNSKNGYYTKVSTLSYKFEISQDRAWEIVGGLLDEGFVESVHDQKSGEMKLCETGKTYNILNLEIQRKRQKSKEFKKKNSPRK
jgi:hypothetical protein